MKTVGKKPRGTYNDESAGTTPPAGDVPGHFPFIRLFSNIKATANIANNRFSRLGCALYFGFITPIRFVRADRPFTPARGFR